MLAVWLFVFVASIYILVKSSDYFTDYAEQLGKVFKLPSFIVGVLIVAVGTSIPELATSIVGVMNGETEFLSGTVIGSSIANILLILGVGALFCKKDSITISWDIVSNDLPFIASSIFLTVVAMLDGLFGPIEAVLFLFGYIIYVFYTYHVQKTETSESKEKLEKEIKKEQKEEAKEKKEITKTRSVFKLFVFLGISLIFVVLSSKFAVDAVINIAQIINIAASVIAATAVALGTSLPELSVSISAARRGNFELVIGNVLGSNIFNIFVVYGIVGMFAPLTMSVEMFSLLIPFFIGSFFLMWLVLIDKHVTKTEALMFILVYIVFLGKSFKAF